MGTNIMMLLSLMIWGACFIHSILSLYLQRSLLLPEVPLKENTPTGIRIMGAITMGFGMLLFFGGFCLLAASPEMIAEAVKQMPPQEQAAINVSILKPLGAVFLVLSFLLTFNANLSFSYLKQWLGKQEQHHQQEEE
ncbi:hypothetical protein [Chitinophaga sp. MM2321]|uniref:hypothetical protein n=1 Tax=Chitinophaga sp. MM2321 TaxID=3137178 RepID=UPI0032D59F88